MVETKIEVANVEPPTAAEEVLLQNRVMNEPKWHCILTSIPSQGEFVEMLLIL